ncbi:hypothetical protein, partial [Rosistilla oblonga]|uniref:hypothetical protein n=1 Tax=Rosistilla oblonga TaxID=2527990 RepID=UPI003A96DBB6
RFIRGGANIDERSRTAEAFMIQSGNVTDHQVAALDDLATTNCGHRHSGASVGYLSFVFRA